jgi:hypothetical protein
MTALCDRPNLTHDELSYMLSLAIPMLKTIGGYGYSLQVPKQIGCVFLRYFPKALQHQRWQVEEIYRQCENYRHVRKDGSYGNRTKRYSKRFAGLIDAITYIEKEFN